MKAIVQDTYGPPQVLRLADVDEPEIGDGEVLVRVRAAGVERGVWHLMTGLPYMIRVMGFGFRGPRQRIPGMDLAGVVEAVGAGVTRFRAGDEVFGAGRGSFAELACAAEDRLVPKPPSLSFEQAAAVPVSGCTALQGLRDHGELEAGQKVLILGASGGVGTFAVQLAKGLGAEVTGECSAAKMDLVRGLGADRVLDYRKDDFAAGATRFDLILDIAGNRPLAHLRRALAPRGTLVIVGGEGGDRWFGGMDRQLRALLLSRFVRQRLRTFIASIALADLEFLKERLEAGGVTPALERTFALGEAAEALHHLQAGRVRGKIALRV